MCYSSKTKPHHVLLPTLLRISCLSFSFLCPIIKKPRLKDNPYEKSELVSMVKLFASYHTKVVLTHQCTKLPENEYDPRIKIRGSRKFNTTCRLPCVCYLEQGMLVNKSPQSQENAIS